MPTPAELLPILESYIDDTDTYYGEASMAVQSNQTAVILVDGVATPVYGDGVPTTFTFTFWWIQP